MPSEWPLIGRVEELRTLSELAPNAGGPAGLVLAGAPGVGKTRLASEAVKRAQARGARTIWAAATPATQQRPLGAFAGHFSAQSLAGSLGFAGADPSHLLSSAIRNLRGSGRPGSLFVAVDDAHLLDDLSATLVYELAMRRIATLVLTSRGGEPAPDAVTALWKDGHLRRVELAALSVEETSELLGVVLGGPIDRAAATELWAITRGNALYLRHLVRGEVESDRLRPIGNQWRWMGGPTLSTGLRELIQSRIGALSSVERAALDMVAFGEPLPVPVLARMIDLSVVEQLETRGLVEVRRPGTAMHVTLAHPLYGELQRARCDPSQARGIRGRLFLALAEHGSSDSDEFLRRGVLMLDSDLPLDPHVLGLAARRAVELIDGLLSERLARAAIASGGGFESRFTLAAARLSRNDDAESELLDAMAHARNDRERVRTLMLRGIYLAWTANRPAEAQAALDAGMRGMTDAEGLHELTSLLVMMHAHLGRPTEAVRIGTELLASRQLSAQADALACLGMVSALAAVGRVAQVGNVAQRGHLAAARSRETKWLSVSMVGFHSLGLRLAGYLDESRALASRASEDFADGVHYREHTAVMCGGEELARGRPFSATEILGQARATLATAFAGGAGALFRCLIELTTAQAQVGDVVASRAALADLEHARHDGCLTFHPELTIAKAWTHAAAGQLARAVELCTEAAAVASAAGQYAHEVVALHTAVRFGDCSHATRLAELVNLVDGPRAPAAAAHAAGLAADDGAALTIASRALQNMGDLLAAADAAAHAAASHLRRGNLAGRTEAARALLLAGQCEGATTPALVALPIPDPLTRREQEILFLAARGLSSRDIAKRLVVSVRTVEGHRYRAYAKLGTSDPTVLATLLAEGSGETPVSERHLGAPEGRVGELAI